MTPVNRKNFGIGESDIRIDVEGRWFYRNQPMTRTDIIELFYRNLILNASGEYSIRIGPQTYPVVVEDAAYVVWDVRYCSETEDSEGYLSLLLSDGCREALDPETIQIGENNIPYCHIRNCSHKARFSKAAYYRLADYIRHDPERNSFFLEIQSRRYPISVS